MTIRWFTDADREDLRNAQAERRFLETLELAEARKRSQEGVRRTAAQLQKIENLQIDPTRRRQQ